MKVDPKDIHRVRSSEDQADLVVVYRVDAPRPHMGDELVWEGKRYVMAQLMWSSSKVFGAVALFAPATE